jgi:hypothetical protein
MNQNDQTPEGLARATTRRQALGEAMTDLEMMVAGPASADGWLDRVEVGLLELRKALDAHIEEVEGPGGLLAEIVSVAPRLASHTEELIREHMDLLGSWLRAEATVKAAKDGGTKGIASVRRKVTILLGRLTMHRQAGSDLVFEAYHVDIGGRG